MISPVRDTDGKLLGVVVVLRDFTEAKALALRQKEFVSVVSHELRTPLTSIAGALDIALSDYAGRLNDKQRRYLTMARESCTRLNSIVDDLLDVARSEQGRMPMRFTPLAFDELGSDVAESYRAAGPGQEHRADHPPRGRQHADRRRRRPPDSGAQQPAVERAQVHPRARRPSRSSCSAPRSPKGHVGVSVFNTGEPIPEQARERIFEKFEQLEGSATRRFGGTGLGLAISRAIVEAHRGRIWVDARGRRDQVRLHPAGGARHRRAARASSSWRPPTPRSTGASILVVEPDVHSSYILKGMLMGSGHEVTVAQTPTDNALTAARRDVPDLVVVAAVPGDRRARADRDPSPRSRDSQVRDHRHRRARGGQDAFAARGAHTFVAKPLEPTQDRARRSIG